ncbi:MAG: dicarboxylate/amino acid:cation symporter [Sedimentisphaerales bacterium]|nr:dicarboxylate/amino acid:cation symporter [Sedimentisphaerales bacterium]
MRGLFRLYFKTSLLVRILVCFAVGSLVGVLFWFISQQTEIDAAEQTSLVGKIISCIQPFGQVFVHMLKMIVIPIIFFSLVVGAASLPICRLGRIGLKTIVWYLGCSVLAAVLGTGIALLVSPGSRNAETWRHLIDAEQAQAAQAALPSETSGVLSGIFLGLFRNPFEALASGNFLPIITFALLFGLAIRVSIERKQAQEALRLEQLAGLLEACREAMFTVVEWVLEYAPIGVLALTIVNFGTYGPSIAGPYVSVTAGVVLGISVMVFLVYPLLLWIVTGKNPVPVFKSLRKPMIMAFITRSSAATLPVSLQTAEQELKIHNELAGFSLPLGATINMDGVCVHLPMFAVLAANLFGIPLSIGALAVLVMTTVLSSIGAGGVPGGSLMLLFLILETMGLTGGQVSFIVALALGINPILDMFETMNNVAGDLVCTYVVAVHENLIGTDEPV